MPGAHERPVEFRDPGPGGDGAIRGAEEVVEDKKPAGGERFSDLAEDVHQPVPELIEEVRDDDKVIPPAWIVDEDISSPGRDPPVHTVSADVLPGQRYHVRQIKDACLEVRVLLAESDGIEAMAAADIKHGPGVPKPGVPGNQADDVLQFAPDAPLGDRPEMVVRRSKTSLRSLNAVPERLSQVGPR